jgi:hypothetical protein
MDHEYTFRWTQAEHVRASQAIGRLMTGRRWPSYVVWVAVGLVGGAVLFQPEARNTFIPVLVVLVLVGSVYSSPLSAWLTARRIKREDPCVDDEIRHILSPAAFKVRSKAIAVDVDWGHMVQVVETPEFFLFFFNKRAAYFTPKRAIPPTDLGGVRNSLREWIGSRARLSADPVAAA